MKNYKLNYPDFVIGVWELFKNLCIHTQFLNEYH